MKYARLLAAGSALLLGIVLLKTGDNFANHSLFYGVGLDENDGSFHKLPKSLKLLR